MTDRTCKTCRWNEQPLGFERCQECAQVKKSGGGEMSNYEKAPR